DAPWVGRVEVVVLRHCTGVLTSERSTALGECGTLVNRQVLRRYVADVDGMACLQNVVLRGVSREGGEHQLVDRRLVRARVERVRDHRGAIGRGVVARELERT